MVQSTLPHIIITSQPNTICMFATLLQSGIKIKCRQDISVGAFLHALPDFTMEYITEEIETIFLDGTPVDDLETTFSLEEQTLALSSAMPGLAGAILRRNSLHSALRTVKKEVTTKKTGGETTVLVKLFNTIAQTRGPKLLKDGVIINAERLDRLFTTRHTLLSRITNITCSGKNISAPELRTLLSGASDVVLTIHE